MEAWKTIVNIALLGTEKRGNTPNLLAKATGVELPEHSSLDTEAAFLRDTAMLSAYRRGGMQPLRSEIVFEGAAPETRPYCGAASDAALADILHAGNTGLLRLWLRMAQSREQLIPPRHLTAVLDAAQKLFVAHPAVRDAAGKRGVWLSTFNPEWSYLLQPANEDHWETGSSMERSAWLQRLRHSDPSKARELLESVWEREPADQRERLLATFETGLSDADLQFLERVSSDKSKRVKAQAVGLLQKLSASSIVSAFEAWLKNAVHVQTSKKLFGMISSTEIVITSPGITDTLMDGLEKKPPAGMNESTYRLQQISSSVPPDFWERHLDLPPEKALERLVEASPDVFPDALIASTDRFGNRLWAAILAERVAGFHPVLLPMLDRALQDVYLKRFAESQAALVLQYYSLSDDEWLPEIAPALLAYAASQPYQYPKNYFATQAWQMPLSLLPELDGITPSIRNSPDYIGSYAAQIWPSSRHQLRDALELKSRIIHSFT